MRERIAALDAVRGVAVGGILLANVTVFFGIMFLAPEQGRRATDGRADCVAAFLEHVLVEGKFYSIFSLLFGIGFGVQLARGGDAAVSRFRRRLRILVAIGAVHAFLIWAGDILLLYALLGFTMPWFARRTDRVLLRWVVVLLAIPTALYIVGLGVAVATGSIAPPGVATAGDGMPPEIMARFAAIGTGGVLDALIGNLMFVVGRWVDLFVTMRFPKVLGMFVLGLWAVRHWHCPHARCASRHLGSLARTRVVDRHPTERDRHLGLHSMAVPAAITHGPRGRGVPGGRSLSSTRYKSCAYRFSGRSPARKPVASADPIDQGRMCLPTAEVRPDAELVVVATS